MRLLAGSLDQDRKYCEVVLLPLYHRNQFRRRQEVNPVPKPRDMRMYGCLEATLRVQQSDLGRGLQANMLQAVASMSSRAAAAP